MYNYDFKESEESILKTASDVNIKMDNEYYYANFVLTEKNLLIFYDINRGNPVWGVGTHPLPELHLLFSVSLKNLKYENKEDGLYIISNDNEINCYDFNLKEFLSIYIS